MPRRVLIPTALDHTMTAQDGVLHRDQALALGLSPGALRARVRSRRWRTLLPQVFLAASGEPTRRQRLTAALLYCGTGCAVDSVDACRFYGLASPSTEPNDPVYVAAPFGSTARSYGFVVVRRTVRPIITVNDGSLPVVDAATAVVAASHLLRSERAVLAAFSHALQRRVVGLDELVRAHEMGSPRLTVRAARVLDQLGAGVLSIPEADFQDLVAHSPLQGHVEYNVWLRLSGGRLVCVDALIASSGVVHETNGRSAHAREDLFTDMQERHDALTASGFVVLHNPPSRLAERGPQVIGEVLRCHRLYEGRGLPDGVVRVSAAA